MKKSLLNIYLVQLIFLLSGQSLFPAHACQNTKNDMHHEVSAYTEHSIHKLSQFLFINKEEVSQGGILDKDFNFEFLNESSEEEENEIHSLNERNSNNFAFYFLSRLHKSNYNNAILAAYTAIAPCWYILYQ